MTIELIVGGIEVQATLRDLLLMAAIFTHSLSQSPNESAPNTEAISDITQESPHSMKSRSSTIYDIKCPSVFLVVVILSDLQQQILPVIKFHASLANACILGSDISMSGGCVLAASADFYNTHLSSWEPFIEHIDATASLSQENDEYSSQAVIIDVTDLQVNVSSLMLKTIIEISVYKSTNQHIDHGVYLQNRLGEPIDIIHCATGDIIVSLLDEQPMPLPLETSEELSRPTHPGVVNISFRGEAHQGSIAKGVAIAQPSLRGYRVSVRKPLPISAEDIKFTGESFEEVFENQRYSLSDRRWLPPFLISDPSKWTAVATGLEAPSIKSYPLPSHWEWTSPWEVAFDSGSFLDPQGFEYALNFIHFSGASRARQSFDVVRRRKWRRCKQLVRSGFVITDSYIFSSISEDHMGRSVLTIEGSIRVTNITSLALLCSFSRETNSIAGESRQQLKGYESVYLPFSYGTPASIRLSVDGAVWSYHCSLSQLGAQEIELEDSANKKMLYLSVSCVRNGRHLCFVVAPKALMKVCIPINIKLSLGSIEHEISGGDTLSFIDVDLKAITEARISVANHIWSDPFRLMTDATNQITFSQASSPITLILSHNTNHYGTQMLKLQSRAVLRNHCDLELQFRVSTSSLVKEKKISSIKRSNLYSLQKLTDEWIGGDSGVKFVDLQVTDYFNIGVTGTWSDALTAAAVENTKVAFEVPSPEMKHQLVYCISHLDGDYRDTTLVTVMHKFRILNADSAPVFVRSVNAASLAEAFELRCNAFTPWSPAASGKITKGLGRLNLIFCFIKNSFSLFQKFSFRMEYRESGP